MDLVVAAVIKRDDGKFLVIRRGRKLEGYPSALCFVGGRVSHEDNPEPGLDMREERLLSNALVREVREEIGGEVVILSLDDVEKCYRYMDEKKRFEVFMIECELDMEEDDSLNCCLREVDELRWMTPQEMLKEKDLIPSLRAWAEAQ